MKISLSEAAGFSQSTCRVTELHFIHRAFFCFGGDFLSSDQMMMMMMMMMIFPSFISFGHSSFHLLSREETV